MKGSFNIKDTTLQKEEVSEVRWFSFDEFKKLVNSEEHVPLAEDFKEILLNIIEENIKLDYKETTETKEN